MKCKLFNFKQSDSANESKIDLSFFLFFENFVSSWANRIHRLTHHFYHPLLRQIQFLKLFIRVLQPLPAIDFVSLNQLFL